MLESKGRLIKIATPIALLTAAFFGAYLLWATRPEVAAKPAREVARAVAAALLAVVAALLAAGASVAAAVPAEGLGPRGASRANLR